MCRTRTLLSIAFSAVTVVCTPALGEGLRDGLRAHLAGLKGSPLQKVAPFQKAVPIQKMAPLQKGSIFQKGGCSAGPRCGCGSSKSKGGCGGGCNNCCLLPTLLNGIGNFIEGFFRCNACCASYSKSGKGCGAPSCCGGKGGKSYGGGSYVPMTPFSPSNPFIPDDLTPSPVPVTEARVLKRAPVYNAKSIASRSFKTPRRISVLKAQPLGKVTQASLQSRERVVIRANNESEAEAIPTNPLRN